MKAAEVPKAISHEQAQQPEALGDIRSTLDEALRLFDEASSLNPEKNRRPLQKLSIVAYLPEPQPRDLILLDVSAGQNEETTQLIFNLEKKAPASPGYAAISETVKIASDRKGPRFFSRLVPRRYRGDRNLRKLYRG